METVSVSRSIPGSRDATEAAMNDLEPFMEAAGFDEVTVDGDRFTIGNHVGLLSIELDLRRVDSEDALTYEQVDGIFEAMTTSYSLHEEAETTTVTAVTEFELDVSLVGPLLDATVVTRQRRKELTAQLAYLERTVG